MTEKQFWQFLEREWKEKGRMRQVSGVMDTVDPVLRQHGQYIGGHAILPNGYDKIPESFIIEMGGLLSDRSVSHKTKEAIMILLAHMPLKSALGILKRYNTNPDIGLGIFAQIALDECQMWNG